MLHEHDANISRIRATATEIVNISSVNHSITIKNPAAKPFVAGAMLRSGFTRRERKKPVDKTGCTNKNAPKISKIFLLPAVLTISIFIEEAESFLEFGNLFFG